MTDLKHLADLADDLFGAQGRVAELESDLKDAQARVRQLSQFDIPDAMDDVGLTELATSSGLEISVTDDVKAGNLKRPAGLAWLRKIGEAGCIKTGVAVPFTAGSEADADTFLARLAGEGIAATKSAEVNHMTLKSIIRQKLKEGVEVPLDVLGAMQLRKAAVKLVKK